MPKLVYLNNRSIIHMMFGNMSCLALKQVIINGTSAVLWWLAITNVLVFFCRHGAMLSPSSTTEAVNTKINWWIENGKIEKNRQNPHMNQLNLPS